MTRWVVVINDPHDDLDMLTSEIELLLDEPDVTVETIVATELEPEEIAAAVR